MASSSLPQQPFPYLDDTCILWCTPSDTANIKQWLANQDALFFGSFLNECAKTIDLSGDHWRSKDAGGLTREQSAVYKCLRARPINVEALVAIMQSYAEGKFRRGITKKGVVDLSNGDVGKFCPPPSTALCKTTPSKCKMLFKQVRLSRESVSTHRLSLDISAIPKNILHFHKPLFNPPLRRQR